MRCPHCFHEVYQSWNHLFKFHSDDGRLLPQSTYALEEGQNCVFHVDWMNCPNAECRHLIIRGVAWAVRYGVPQQHPSATWFILPRKTTRPVDPVVLSERPEYAKDYREAAAILEDSPKMSATLSRRILAELLKDFGGYDQHRLSSRIEAFTKDASNPKGLRDNLDYLREIGDFGAHAQKDDVTGSIIEVE